MSSEIGLLYGVIGSVLAVPVVLFLHWYYLSRVLVGIAWRSRYPWLYPAMAAAAFVAHMHFAVARSKSDLTPFAQAKELPFLVGGACIVFACALGGPDRTTLFMSTAPSEIQAATARNGKIEMTQVTVPGTGWP